MYDRRQMYDRRGTYLALLWRRFIFQLVSSWERDLETVQSHNF